MTRRIVAGFRQQGTSRGSALFLLAALVPCAGCILVSTGPEPAYRPLPLVRGEPPAPGDDKAAEEIEEETGPAADIEVIRQVRGVMESLRETGPDREIAKMAASALDAIGPQARDAVWSFLFDGDVTVSLFTTEYLIARKMRKRIPRQIQARYLVAIIRGDAPIISSGVSKGIPLPGVVRALVKLGAPAIPPALRAFLTASDGYVKDEFETALAALTGERFSKTGQWKKWRKRMGHAIAECDHAPGEIDRVEVMKRLREEGEEDVRAVGVPAIALLGGGDVLEVVLSAFDDPSPELRRAGARAWAYLPKGSRENKSLLTAMRKAVNDPEVEVVVEVARAGAARPAEYLFDGLIGVLGHESPRVREAAAIALRSLRDSHACASLLDCARYGAGSVRDSALEALEACLPEDIRPKRPKDEPVSFDEWHKLLARRALETGFPIPSPIMPEEREWKNRTSVAESTGSVAELALPDKVQYLVWQLDWGTLPEKERLLEEPHFQVLVSIGPDAAPQLYEILNSPDPLTRSLAARALGIIGGRGAKRALAARKKTERSEKVGEFIEKALSGGEIPPKAPPR